MMTVGERGSQARLARLADGVRVSVLDGLGNAILAQEELLMI